MDERLKLEERTNFAPARIVESETEGDKRTHFEALLSEGDYINGNGRMYPLDVLWPAFEAANQNISRHFGAVDHPEEGFFGPGFSVTDIGIAWERFWLEGKQIFGRGAIVPTAKGKDLEAVLLAGVPIGFSTRGIGSSEERDLGGQTVSVITSYELESIDAVTTPSVDHARPRNVTKEDLEMNEELKQALEAIRLAETALVERRAAVEAQESEALGRVAVLEGQIEQLRTENSELVAQLKDANAKLSAADFTNTLNSLTDSDRFGAAIRQRVTSLVESGVSVSVQQLESVVENFRQLVNGLATGSNDSEGEPKGDLSTDEDNIVESGPTMDDAQLKLLRDAGLAE